MSVNDPMMESKHHLPECMAVGVNPRNDEWVACICERRSLPVIRRVVRDGSRVRAVHQG